MSSSKKQSAVAADSGSKGDGKIGAGGMPIEPVMVLHMASAMMAFMVIPDVLLQKACRVNLAYDGEVCSALEARQGDKFPDQDQELQKLTGMVLMWRAVLENLFPMVLVCLIGAWSDKYGRKPPMLCVLLAFTIQHLCLIACANENNGLVGGWTIGLVSSLIVSLTGNIACFAMCAFSYIADITPKEKLSQKTAIAGSTFFLGITIGMGLGGGLAGNGYSFAQVFGLAAAMELFAFSYVALLIPNVRDEKAIKGVTTSQMVRDIFNLNHIKDAVSSVFKKRPGNDRLKLLLLLLCHSLIMAPLMGEGGVFYLFGRGKFGWDIGEFSMFMTYKTITGFIGNIVSMVVLGGMLKLSDPGVGVASCVSNLVGCFLFAFATSNFIMYLTPIVTIFNGAIMHVARGIIGKIVPGNETGKVNSFIGSLESLVPLLSAPTYTLVYTATSETFPGAFFLISAAAMVPPILIYTWLLSEKKKTA